MTLLAALVFQRTQEVTDALVTLLIQIVHRIGTRAERRVEAAYLNDLKRVAGNGNILGIMYNPHYLEVLGSTKKA
jgi:hypothetical protein